MSHLSPEAMERIDCAYGQLRRERSGRPDTDMRDALADLENTSTAIQSIIRVLDRDRAAIGCEGEDVLDNLTAGGLLEALRIVTDRLDSIGAKIECASQRGAA